MVRTSKNFLIITACNFLAVLCACLLAGCGSSAFYVPPQAPSDAASIRGARESTNFFLSDRRVFPCLIDGAPIDDADDYSEQTLLVPPGQRIITVVFTQGDLVAATDFVVQVYPGQRLSVEGRVVEYGDSIFHMGPSKVAFSLLDESLNSKITPEIVKPVGFRGHLFIPIPIPVRK